MRDHTIELKYAISQLYSRVKQFKQKSSNSWNFRCPICGDSEKSKTKARGNIYQNTKGGFSFKCFNCGEAKSVQQFLKENYKDLYDEYRFSILKERKEIQEESRKVFRPLKDSFDKALLIPADKHIRARSYLVSRQIPQDKWKYFYYCNTLGSFIKSNRNDSRYDRIKDDGEFLVTPIINWIASNRKEVVQAVCCRNIGEGNEKFRYIHAKFRDDCVEDQVIWNLDKIDRNKPIICVEGIFDALFLDNAIALLTSSKVVKGYDNCQLIYLLDNEPRNKEIVKVAENHARAGRTISILPPSYQKYGKDINEYIKKGICIQKIQSDILLYSYNGPRAILEIQKWKRI